MTKVKLPSRPGSLAIATCHRRKCAYFTKKKKKMRIRMLRGSNFSADHFNICIIKGKYTIYDITEAVQKLSYIRYSER